MIHPLYLCMYFFNTCIIPSGINSKSCSQLQFFIYKLGAHKLSLNVSRVEVCIRNTLSFSVSFCMFLNIKLQDRQTGRHLDFLGLLKRFADSEEFIFSKFSLLYNSVRSSPSDLQLQDVKNYVVSLLFFQSTLPSYKHGCI